MSSTTTIVPVLRERSAADPPAGSLEREDGIEIAKHRSMLDLGCFGETMEELSE